MKTKKTPDAIELMGPDRIAAAKAKYGELIQLVIEADELGAAEDLVLVVHKPSRSEFARFLRDSQVNAFNAMRRLVLDCALHPSDEELTAVLEGEPGLVVTLGNKLAQVAKANLEVLEKKV